MKNLARSILTLAAVVATSNGQATFVTVPFLAEAGDMDSDTYSPLNIGSNATMRYQQVYDAADFEIRAPDGGYIYAISFRPDAELGRFVGTILPSIQVNLSTTARAADSVSPFFADNIGPDETVVYGPTSLHVLTGGEPTFNVGIQLAQPFFYNPHAGNLLMDIRNFGGGDTTYLDATEVVGDSVSRVWAWDVNSASGTLDTRGLITGFSVTPVPEPSAALLLITGLGVWALYARHRRSTHSDSAVQRN